MELSTSEPVAVTTMELRMPVAVEVVMLTRTTVESEALADSLAMVVLAVVVAVMSVVNELEPAVENTGMVELDKEVETATVVLDQ